MEKISNRLAEYLLDNQASSDELDDVRFGIELILTQTTLLLSIIVIGILFDSIVATVIYLVVLFSLRTVSEGYHADSFSKCAFITVVTYLACLFAYKIINDYIVWICLLYVFKVFIIQDASSLKKNALICKVLVILYPVAFIALSNFNCTDNVIAITMFISALSVELERHGEKRKNL